MQGSGSLCGSSCWHGRHGPQEVAFGELAGTETHTVPASFGEGQKVCSFSNGHAALRVNQ